MSFFLIEPGLDISIELHVPVGLEQSLELQIGRLTDSQSRQAFLERLRIALTNSLPDALDWDIKPATEAQRAYARSLAHKFGVPIPHEAMNRRGEMHRFIEHYARMAKDIQSGKSGSFSDDIPF